MSGSEAVTIDDLAGDPHPHLARLRAEAPVAWVPALDSFLVTSLPAAVAVLRDPATFTVDDPRFSTAQVVGPSMLSRDGEEQARHRRPFVAPFRPREVAAGLEPFIRVQIDSRLDRLDTNGRRGADMRTSVAAPLAAAVVAQRLGLDGRQDDVVERLVGWYGEIVSSVSAVATGRPITAASHVAMAELGDSLRECLRDDHSLLGIAAAHGGLGDAEVISNAGIIMFGGIETTEGMILNALWHVLNNPAVTSELRATPSLVAAAVEESLRLEPAAAVVDRYATRDVALAGTAIEAGAMVTVSLAGANRDPAEFADPDRFDLRRPNARRHLAFAAGPHVCIGMDLARLEARLALTAVLARFPALRLAPDAPPPTGLVFRKPQRLPVEW